MPGISSSHRTITSTQHNLTQNADTTQANTINAVLVLLFPVVIICTIASYRKYRAIVMQRQIQRLNRLWQLDSSKKLI
jgi:hypothetical protein